jgi:cell division protein FtsL
MRPGISRSAALMAVLLSITVLFVGLFYVWTRMQIVQVGYEISALKSTSRDLKNRKRELELEIASLQSPRELEKKARKLGLVSPAMRSVVHVP